MGTFPVLENNIDKNMEHSMDTGGGRVLNEGGMVLLGV